MFLGLLAEFVEAAVQEVEEGGDVLLVTERAAQGVALRVDAHIEGLRVAAELVALQVTPLVAYGAQGAFLAGGLGHLDGLGQRTLVVNKQ